jgi:hypothetical protein
MTRRWALSTLLLVLTVITHVHAGEQPAAPLVVGDPFPRLRAEFLTGRTAVLPDAAQGKMALVMMGFTYDSRFAVVRWAAAFKTAYGTRPDVTFYEVPVIGGLGRAAKWFIDSGMRKGTPRDLHENVITVYGSVSRWKTAMGFSKQAEDAAYLALLDQSGRVRWLYRGGFDESAMASLRAALERDPGIGPEFPVADLHQP